MRKLLLLGGAAAVLAYVWARDGRAASASAPGPLQAGTRTAPATIRSQSGPRPSLRPLSEVPQLHGSYDGPIIFRVVDSLSGEPIEDAVLWTSPELDGEDAEELTRSDAEGMIELDWSGDLPALAWLSVEGFAPRILSQDDLYVEAGDVALDALATVAVRMRDDSTADFGFRRDGHLEAQVGYSSWDSEWRVAQVSPGAVTVIAVSGEGAIVAEEMIQLEPGESRELILSSLAVAQRATVRVRDRFGQPIADATVTYRAPTAELEGTSLDWQGVSSTDASGVATVPASRSVPMTVIAEVGGEEVGQALVMNGGTEIVATGHIIDCELVDPRGDVVPFYSMSRMISHRDHSMRVVGIGGCGGSGRERMRLYWPADDSVEEIQVSLSGLEYQGSKTLRAPTDSCVIQGHPPTEVAAD